MSLVGTRPPTVDEWDKYLSYHSVAFHSTIFYFYFHFIPVSLIKTQRQFLTAAHLVFILCPIRMY